MADKKEQKSTEVQEQKAPEASASTQPSPKKKNTKRNIIIAVVVILAVFVVVGVASGNKSSDSADSNSSTTTAKKSNSKYEVSIDDAQVKTEYGKKVIVVTYTFTNNSDKETMFMTAVNAHAYQNGVSLDSAITKDGTNSKTMSQVQPGTTVTFNYAYELEDTSDVQVKVTELFNSSSVLADKTFSVN